MDAEELEEEVTEKKSFKEKLKGNVWFRIGKNKYILTVAFFLTWMMFFDNNNWVYLNKLTDEAHLKQTEKSWYKREIKDSERKLHELTSDLTALEKFARETYYMKRSNEDVFVFFPQKEEDPINN
jgi:cell division protein DivIC